MYKQCTCILEYGAIASAPTHTWRPSTHTAKLKVQTHLLKLNGDEVLSLNVSMLDGTPFEAIYIYIYIYIHTHTYR